MKKATILSILIASILAPVKIFSQCSGTAPTFTVDLSAKPDTAWTINSTRSGSACAGTTCVQFVVIINPQTTLLNFDVTNPSPSGSAFYQINCGSSVAVGTPSCVAGQTSFCITYCKAGADNPIYHIIANRGYSAGHDIVTRQGCTRLLNATGFQKPSITWTSVNPGTAGAYNAYMSCTSGCDSVFVNPGPGAPTFVDYVVSGNLNNGCAGTFTDTVRVNIAPPLNVNITASDTFICTGGSAPVTLTTSVSGGLPPYTYIWHPGGQTTSSIVESVPGTDSVFVYDTLANCPFVKSFSIASVPTPASPVAASNSPVCENGSLNLSASTIAGAVYNWSGPNAFSSSSQNANITSVALADAGTFSVTAYLNGCTSFPGTVIVNVDPLASVNAGADQSVCANNSAASLNGTLTGATGILWSTSGTGTFSPDSLSLNAIYSPGAADISAGSVVLALTSTGNGACTAANDQMTLSIIASPAANAGTSLTICGNSSATLNGTVTNAAGGLWSASGTGTFSPNNSSLNAIYMPGSADVSAGSVVLYLTSTGNGVCAAAGDSIVLNITPAPTANAGTNQSVCANNSVATLNGTATNTSGVIWSTSGTGTFSPGNTSLNTSYAPGAADISAGNVTLYLVSSGNGVCATASDSVVLSITPAPTANAGTNQSVCSNGMVALNGTITVAGGGIWISTGSGTFNPNNSTLNAVYVPSSADAIAGTVTIILNTASNGNCIAATDSMTVNINATGITGIISYSAGFLAGSNVFLIAQGTTSSLYDTIAVTSSDGSGVYTFAAVDSGNYYMRAEAGSSYPNLINTYFGDRYLWDSAKVVLHGCAVTDSASITMVELPTGLSGPCTISGFVYEGTGFGQKLIVGTSPVIMTNVIPGVPVKVGKNPSGTIVASGQTDSSGYFSFGNLPYDSYTIYTDIPGYPMDSSYSVNLSPGNETATDLNYIVDSNSVYIDLTTSVKNTAEKLWGTFVFPNPTSGAINIQFSNAALTEVIRLFDAAGRMIYTSKDLLAGQDGNSSMSNIVFHLDLNELGLSTGVYLLHLQNSGKKFKINFIKN